MPSVRAAGDLPTPLVDRPHGPFVGRADLLDELDDAWRVGAWRALIVAGEPGIGKTRLLAELAAPDARCRSPRRRRPAATRTTPSATDRGRAARSDRRVADCHRAAARSAPTSSVRWRSRPGRAVRLGRVRSIAQGRRRRPPRPARRRASSRVLRIAGPTVLVLDDLHWIDAPSLGILRRVVAAAIPDLTVLAAYRDTDVAAGSTRWPRCSPTCGATTACADSSSTASTVPPWSRSSSARRAAARRGDHLVGPRHPRPHGRQPAVRRRAHQPPRRARRARLPTTRPAGAATTCPSASSRSSAVGSPGSATSGGRAARRGRRRAALRRRRRRGDRRARPRAPTGRRTGRPTCWRSLERARDAGVVVDDDDGMAFRHAVIRSALLDPMSAARRQRLHRDIATVLERMWASIARPPPRGAGVPPRPGPVGRRAGLVPAGGRGGRRRARRQRRRPRRARPRSCWRRPSEPDPELRCDLLIARAVGLRLAGRETIADARRATDAAIALGDQERIAAALLSLSVRVDRRATHAEHLAFLTAGLAHLTDARPGQPLARRRRAGDPHGDGAVRATPPSTDASSSTSSTTSTPTTSRRARSPCAARGSLTGINLAPVRGTDRRALRAELRRRRQRRPARRARAVDDVAAPRRPGSRRIATSTRRRTIRCRRHWLFDCQVRQRQVMRAPARRPLVRRGRRDRRGPRTRAAQDPEHPPRVRGAAGLAAARDRSGRAAPTRRRGRWRPAQPGAPAAPGRARLGRRRGRPRRRRPRPARPAGRRRLRRRRGRPG